MTEIRPKDRDAIIQSLRAGVAPRTAQHLIQVGRKREIEAILQDIDRVAAGGAAVKFVIGEYGAGKTFFLNLTRSIAMEKGLVTARADLAPGKRLHATAGYAKALYMELMHNLSTRTRTEGGAMTAIVERFVATVHAEAQEKGASFNRIVQERLEPLTALVHGFDFAEIIAAYAAAASTGDEEQKAKAVRWLRGEYAAKSDARNALGVRTIIDDSNWYDALKLFAAFTRLAGYKGLLVCLDEMVNIYKLNNKQARISNYEQILRIVNDTLQGTVCGLGFMLGGTPEFQLDTRRGMFSYDALRRRLGENAFAKRQGMVDFSGPVMSLSGLTQENFYVLLEKIRFVYAFGDEQNALLPVEALEVFMQYCARRLGSNYFRSPGTMITAFINLLAVLEQNPGSNWKQLLGNIELVKDTGGEQDTLTAADDDMVEM